MERNEGHDEDEEENWMATGWSDETETDAMDGMGSFDVTKRTSSGIQDGGKEMSIATDSKMMSRMELNTHKAGMEGLDKEKINAIIYEASKGSKFYENEQKKEEQVNKRIEHMKSNLTKITDLQKHKAAQEVDKMVEELQAQRDLSRSIVHIDMDMFYAAVEMRDTPSLKDKPMAVGGMGMLSTSNYKARRFGVRAAMPGFIGKKLCPELVIIAPNFDKYRAVSRDVREILMDYDPNFVPMSLDEAYLDFTEHLEKRRHFSEQQRMFAYRPKPEAGVTSVGVRVPQAETCESASAENGSVVNRQEQHADNRQTVQPTSDMHRADSVVKCSGTDAGNKGDEISCRILECFGLSVEEAVREMRFRIEQKTQLTASAGIAPNTMLAKICSDKNKPNGQYRIQPTLQAVTEFIKDLPIRKVSGIGKVTEKMLNALNVTTCTDLYNHRVLLHLLFSKTSSQHFLRISLGLGSNKLERDGDRKSMSTERTFREISDPAQLYEKCLELSEALAKDLQSEKLKGKTVTLKIKLVTFETKTRALTLPCATNSAEDIYNASKELLKTEINAAYPEPLRLRLMGVRMSSFAIQGASSEKQGSIIHFLQKTAAQKPAVTDSGNDTAACTSKRLDSDKGVDGQLFPKTVGPSGSSHSVAVAKTVPSDRRRPGHDTCVLIDLDDATAKQATEITQLHTRTVSNRHAEKDSWEFHGDSSILPDATSSTVQKDVVYTCPICNYQQTNGDLGTFNSHVDLCLNKGAIQDILENEAQDSVGTSCKRSLPDVSHNNNSKKRKREKNKTSTFASTSSNTLDRFFTTR